MNRRLILPALAVSLLVARPAAAVQLSIGDPNVVDRVMAVVGDSVVLMTQLLEEVETRRLQNPEAIPTDPVGLQRVYRDVLNQLVDRVLVIQEAARDTLVQVEDERVDEIVTSEIEARAQRFGGRPAMAEALQSQGLTLSEYREILSSQVRQQQLSQIFMQRRLQGATPADVTDEELREAYDAMGVSEQERPRLVSFEQVVIAPEPSDSAKADARSRAQAIVDSIRGGADFQEMARRYSEDPGSAPNGGDLDWFRRGQMVNEFEDAAFSLGNGQVSDLVETEFGFHIIKIDRSRPGERKGRHILIRAAVTAADFDRARALADTVVEQARAGASMAELFEKYSDPLAPDTLTVTYDQLEQLPPTYAELRAAGAGDVVGPLEYETAGTERRYSVVRIREIREAGSYTFEDVKPQLVEEVQRQKLVERVLQELRDKTHIEIRM